MSSRELAVARALHFRTSKISLAREVDVPPRERRTPGERPNKEAGDPKLKDGPLERGGCSQVGGYDLSDGKCVHPGLGSPMPSGNGNLLAKAPNHGLR